jgi:hypothetical protein
LFEAYYVQVAGLDLVQGKVLNYYGSNHLGEAEAVRKRPYMFLILSVRGNELRVRKIHTPSKVTFASLQEVRAYLESAVTRNALSTTEYVFVRKQ